MRPLPFCYCKKQIDVSFSCVCPVIDHELRHNIVKVAVDPRGDSLRIDINLLNRLRWLTKALNEGAAGPKKFLAFLRESGEENFQDNFKIQKENTFQDRNIEFSRVSRLFRQVHVCIVFCCSGKKFD